MVYLRLACLLILPAILGCERTSKPVPNSPDPDEVDVSASAVAPWLRDITSSTGIDFTYRNGEEADEYTILESLGGGVGLIDYDNDGLLDVVLPGGGHFENQSIKGHPTKLFRNLGGSRFEEVLSQAGLAHESYYTHGCAVADYDRDGWQDLAITGYGRITLFHNEDGGQGGRRFVDATESAGLDDALWSTSAGWGDIDGDHDPDLFVCHYVDWSFENNPVCKKAHAPKGRDVCNPERFQPQMDYLYLNNGDGTFTNATEEYKLRGDGCGLGVVLLDVDDNGQPDIYVANDATPNFLYLNRDGRLEERGAIAGVALDEEGVVDGSMGVDAADFDGRGRPALWVTNFEKELHALYANAGNGLFQHHSKAAGLGAIGRRYVSFGTGFADFDHDGWEDLLFVGGHVFRHPTEAPLEQRPVLLANTSREGRRFYLSRSEAEGGYFQKTRLGRGLALGDLDNDGGIDVVVSHSNSPVAVLKNIGTEKVSDNWIGIELAGPDHRDVVGSTVSATIGDRRLTRYAKGGGSYLSSGDRRIVFGLGDKSSPVQVTVRWSWGKTEQFTELTPGKYHRLVEGSGTSR